MKLRSVITVVILALICLGATACNRTGENTTSQVKAEPETSLETTTPKQWQPKHDTEGQLEVTVEPANAKIDLVSLGEQGGILPIKVKILDFGHNNGNPNNREAGRVRLQLERSRFISQDFELYELNQEVTRVLVRVSFEPAKIRESFERVAQTYRMPVAYPTYIPGGYRLDENEFHANTEEEAVEQPEGLWFLVWAQGVSPVSWGHGTSSITLRFPGGIEEQDGMTQKRVGPSQWRQRMARSNGKYGPETFRPVKVDDHISAEVSTRRAVFFVDGALQSWDILFGNISITEAEKIVKGMRLVEYGE